MKKIFLIGDSIRLGAYDEDGYGNILKKSLEGRAEVFQPVDNCRFAQYTLRYLHEWASQCPKNIDYVLWNNGLWDTLHLTGETEALTPYYQYLYYLERVYKRICYVFPGAKVIFVSTTNVIEDMAPPESLRDNEEIITYNLGARSLMEKLGADYFDLYPYAEEIPRELRSDWVHYKTGGSKILADVLCKYLTENYEI